MSELELESIRAERDALLKWQRERKDYKAECIRLRQFIRKEVMHPLSASPRLRKLALEALEGK